ncbi:hypothetical protein BDZ94DRAFT_1254440 [Collybia nuda]|uniref:Transmembrane protein n=1 Tax=Collybia nuda TaxID=64659 RepID=A0A9P6CFH0_9AGAR|nr:hypothetical protein BDZ94DRAFT_1269549 [Collybia nuda]KAF9465083.1 hypothetical protein BDZ94DRAFT_1254440 [Collybia nuda]
MPITYYRSPTTNKQMNKRTEDARVRRPRGGTGRQASPPLLFPLFLLFLLGLLGLFGVCLSVCLDAMGWMDGWIPVLDHDRFCLGLGTCDFLVGPRWSWYVGVVGV